MKKKSPLFWVVVSGLVVVVAGVGAFTVSRGGKLSQARHDVQVIALTLDGFARENGSEGALEGIREQGDLRLV